jgi:hypothetical protein
VGNAEGEKKMTRNDLIATLTDELSQLHNLTMLKNAAKGDHSMDYQCINRFGCSWEMIREQVFHDVDAMERWNANIDNIAHNRTTGNWMINELMLVWMLRKRLRQVNQNVPSNFHGFGGRLDMERVVSKLESSSQEPDQLTLFYVAPILVPYLAKEILASHGIEV